MSGFSFFMHYKISQRISELMDTYTTYLIGRKFWGVLMSLPGIPINLQRGKMKISRYLNKSPQQLASRWKLVNTREIPRTRVSKIHQLSMLGFRYLTMIKKICWLHCATNGVSNGQGVELRFGATPIVQLPERLKSCKLSLQTVSETAEHTYVQGLTSNSEPVLRIKGRFQMIKKLTQLAFLHIETCAQYWAACLFPKGKSNCTGN